MSGQFRTAKGGARARRDIDGILLLDKPLGLSSNQVLQRVKALYRARKAGHTGSLDPLASGMLPICFGQATKVSAYLLESDKSYLFRVRFGVQTATGDSEGGVVATGASEVGETALRQAVASLRGAMEQVPPMFSALKRGGKRLYELARMGQTVARVPRPIQLWSFDVVVFDPTSPQLLVRCSKGTYIRVLAEDLATRLGTVGHVTELRRLAVAPFDEAEMVTMDVVENAATRDEAGLDRLLLPLDRAVAPRPAVCLSVADAARVRQGQSVRATPEDATEGPVRIYDHAGGFIGMGERLPDGQIVPRRLMAPPGAVRTDDAGL